jgi:hypothetical protein
MFIPHPSSLDSLVFKFLSQKGFARGGGPFFVLTGRATAGLIVHPNYWNTSSIQRLFSVQKTGQDSRASASVGGGSAGMVSDEVLTFPFDGSTVSVSV